MTYYSPNLLILNLMISLAMLVVPGIAMGIFWWWEARQRDREVRVARAPAEERREPESRAA